MSPFSIEDLEDLGIYDKKELDNIHRVNKYIISGCLMMTMFLILLEFINLL